MARLENEIRLGGFKSSRPSSTAKRHNNTWGGNVNTSVRIRQQMEAHVPALIQSTDTPGELLAAALSQQRRHVWDWGALWESLPCRGRKDYLVHNFSWLPHISTSWAVIYGQIVKHFVKFQTNACKVILPKSNNVTLMRNRARWYMAEIMKRH